jgi:molybdopterin-guanine dinucleotide biosynthesis protein B
MIPVVSLVGYSNSGKTTVIVGLIRILKERACRVAVVKHAAHGYNLDTLGTDSGYFAEAGADQVVIAGPNSFTLYEYDQEEISLADIVTRIKDVDIILVEGFKRETGPKIEIYRQDNSLGRIPIVGQLIAIVSDVLIPGNLPQFSFEQLENLADFIVQHIISR